MYSVVTGAAVIRSSDIRLDLLDLIIGEPALAQIVLRAGFHAERAGRHLLNGIVRRVFAVVGVIPLFFQCIRYTALSGRRTAQHL